MDALLLTVAVAGVAISFYTHLRLGDFVHGSGRTLGLRIFLVLLGVGIGAVAAFTIRHPSPALLFLAGFCVVHIPPAIVIMLKGLRGEGRS